MPPSEGKSRWSIDTVLIALDVCFINTPPVPQSFSWERHAPAWLLEPGWSPAIPGESTGEGLTKWTSRHRPSEHLAGLRCRCSLLVALVGNLDGAYTEQSSAS